MEWQPIEFAPKIDDRRILLLCRGEPVVGYWSDHYGAWMAPDPQCGGFDIDTPSHFIIISPMVKE